MKGSTITRRILVIALIFILLRETYPVWVRIFGGLGCFLFYLGEIILGIYLIIRFIKELWRLFKQRNSLSGHNFYSILIILLLTGYLFFTGNILNLEERLYGNIVLKAYYEGTQTQALFTLRDNDDFVVHHTGAFFYDEFRKGKYILKQDTLFLNNSEYLHYTLSDTMLIRDGLLFQPGSDSLTRPDIRIMD
jgi:hypothetical protein